MSAPLTSPSVTSRQHEKAAPFLGEDAAFSGTMVNAPAWGNDKRDGKVPIMPFIKLILFVGYVKVKCFFFFVALGLLPALPPHPCVSLPALMKAKPASF